MTSLAMVTRESLQQMINTAPKVKQIAIVGRALVHIYSRQTDLEKSANDTIVHNGVGFTGTDGHSGCLTAKAYIKNKTLQDWQLRKWLKRNRHGISRITKYHRQLNEIAMKANSSKPDRTEQLRSPDEEDPQAAVSKWVPGK